ncbi:MAG: hypothetical protein OEW08_12695 [Gammaproteobacteria bacterium]|nr:hypothetical protein [Gammaproteobacteria bacterium]
MKTIQRLLSLLFIFCFAPALYAADAPNRYELSGDHTYLRFELPPLVKDAQLVVQRKKDHYAFSGDQIRAQETEIGTLVTVTLNTIPDLRTDTLSFLLPRINMNTDTVWFRSELVWTQHNTTIAGPDLVQGPVQVYRADRLFGRATRAMPAASDRIGTVEGTVMLVNTCPGPVTPGQNCTQPFAGVDVQLIDATQAVVAKALTGKDGVFSLQAAAGDYVLHVVTTGVLPRCADQAVTLMPNTVVSAKLECDSGMR